MLSDQERSVLLDIEHRLAVDDPLWAEAFGATAQRVSRQRPREMAFHVVAVMVWTALSVLMIAADAAGPALFFAGLTAVSIWAIRRLRRHRTDRAPATPSTSPQVERTVVLSDREREALAVIERGFLIEDPSWTRALDPEGQRAARQRRFELACHVVAAMLTGALAVLLYVADAPGLALSFVVISAGLCWLVRRVRRG